MRISFLQAGLSSNTTAMLDVLGIKDPVMTEKKTPPARRNLNDNFRPEVEYKNAQPFTHTQNNAKPLVSDKRPLTPPPEPSEK